MPEKAPAVEEPQPGPTRKTAPDEPREESPKAPDLSAQLDAARKEKEELFRKLQYLQADFENFRKRTARETETVLRFAHEALVLRLLPVLDDFDAALAHAKDDTGKGVRMVRDNLVKALQDVGLTEIPAQGEKFDPYLHDCVQQVPDGDLGDGMVKAVVRKGYRLHDRVLRPSQVIVVKNGSETHG